MKLTRWDKPSMDHWQKKVLAAAKNLILLCGRQVGKSEIISKKLADYLLNNPKKKILIVSGVERQAAGLYNKTLRLIERDFKRELKTGRDKPLKTIFKLKNGSQLITEPLGTDGSGARQHTVDGIVFEEMQLIPEEAFGAITPMLLTTGGWIWMLGTAWATEGYVYERLSDPDFEVFRINSEEVAAERPEPAKTFMLNHLEKEKVRLGETMYAQEYLAIPSDKIRQIFPDSLVKRQQVAERRPINQHATYICGVDPAGLGDDDGSISIFEWDEDRETMTMIEHEITRKTYTTDITDRIVYLNELYDFEKVYVDDGGLGFGVFSELLKQDDVKFKTVALNNSSRPTDYLEDKHISIKEDEMIFNLLALMEQNKVFLLADSEIRESFKSYKFDKDVKTKRTKISSNYNHPVQSIMRAVWHAQTKHLKCFVSTIKV